MKILIEGESKEISELFSAIRKDKNVTYGDVLKFTYGEKNFPKQSQSGGVSIQDAPLVVVAQTDKDADFLR